MGWHQFRIVCLSVNALRTREIAVHRSIATATQHRVALRRTALQTMLFVLLVVLVDVVVSALAATATGAAAATAADTVAAAASLLPVRRSIRAAARRVRLRHSSDAVLRVQRMRLERMIGAVR